jgi:thiamine transporter ThiT
VLYVRQGLTTRITLLISCHLFALLSIVLLLLRRYSGDFLRSVSVSLRLLHLLLLHLHLRLSQLLLLLLEGLLLELLLLLSLDGC